MYLVLQHTTPTAPRNAATCHMDTTHIWTHLHFTVFSCVLFIYI